MHVSLSVLFILFSSTCATLAASSPQAAKGAPGAAQVAREDAWLRSVQPILLAHEDRLYRSLQHDYQRDAFRREFWRVRDPYPQTGRNEFRERYEERLGTVEARYGGFDDDRSRILLTHGEPARAIEVRCTTTRSPAMVWVYNGSELVDFQFVLVFIRDRNGRGPARVWHPRRSTSLQNLLRSARSCVNGGILEDIERQVAAAWETYLSQLDRVLLKPRPRSLEWVAAFRAESTDLPEGATRLRAGLTVDYLGRFGQRTAVRGAIAVPRGQASVGDFAGHRSYDFSLVGEVVQGSERFESFRYKFGFGAEEAMESEPLLLVFQRFLRPGVHRLIVRVEDLNGGGFYRAEQELLVPDLDDAWRPAVERGSTTSALLAEASEALAAGQTRISIVPPSERLQTGFVRFPTVASGEEIARVAFFLDEKLVVTKNRPPFEVELDLGPFPRVRRVRAEALDQEGTRLAWDEVEINAGRQRFAARFVSPRKGAKAQTSVLAEIAVSVPEAAVLERVEFYVDEELRATLYQPPWSQPLALQRPGTLHYLRAVAYLTDGNFAEDIVFLNAPGAQDQVEVQFVELFVSVAERDGSFAENLNAAHFSVAEDGVAQDVQRFEVVEDLPIHIGVVLDNSASMGGALEEARRAVLSFFSQALTPQDRAAVITFNRFPHLAVPLTNDLQVLGGGLAGLSAEGQTSLFDSVVFGLYYLTGVAGQRAILLLSDGRDETSEFSFERTLEYARRAGVTIYTIGLGLPDGMARQHLVRLAQETGGASFFIGEVGLLESIYQRIETDLRSQYLVAYQSKNTSREDIFRRVRVDVEGFPPARVRTMSGYYP